MLTALLAGCVSAPPLGQKPTPRPPETYASAQSLAPAAQASAWPAADWWQAYNDPQLTALIEEGLAGSPDLAAAVARLQQAQGYRLQAGAALRPTLNGKIVAQQTYSRKFPGNVVPDGWDGVGAEALQLNFDLDLWGKNRAALRAARRDDEAAGLDVAQARLTLSTAIASTYADLARLYAERDVDEQTLKVKLATQSLVTNRVLTGLDTKAEQKQADAAVPTARSALLALDEQITLTRHALAALLGQGPDRGLTIARPQVHGTATGLPAGVTTDLIARRPDVAAALARVQAADERIRVAHANFYPQVSLTALAAHPAVSWEDLVKGSTLLGGVGPSITLPIFQGGQLKGQYRTARGTYDEAVASYDKSVANAFHEVADAVTSQTVLTQRLVEAHQALADSEAAYALARLRYEGGLSTYLNVLSAEETVLSARMAYADLQSRAFTLDVALVRALGGGLVSPVAAAAVPQNSKDSHHG